MAYLHLQPLDPAIELMHAQQARVTAQCAGNADVTNADFSINTLKPPPKPRLLGDEMAEYLRARTAKKD
jgi:hypothetical protein